MTKQNLIKILTEKRNELLDEANDLNKKGDYFEGYHKCGVAEGLTLAIDILLMD